MNKKELLWTVLRKGTVKTYHGAEQPLINELCGIINHMNLKLFEFGLSLEEIEEIISEP